MTQDIDFDEGSAIAIVGMAGRFPKAPDIESFWRNIRDGVECLSSFTAEELEDAGEDPSRVALPNYIRVGGPLEGMEDFDAAFFGFSPRDASIMDPQHRHILECAWEALENAAILPDKFEGSIGVFAGSGHNAYMPYNLLTNPALLESVGFFLLRHTGNDKDFLATRISYCLKLTGPSINIQTACSTSLVATHVACQSLLNSECDLALAGGATIELPHRRGYVYEEGEILSPDGHCRAFDAASKGTLFGSGAGVVVLRRYEDAVRDGDIIHAVIRGSAVNNDGANKVGYLAPSVEGQASCMAEAIALADVAPRTITYVECHGTGTPVGDPIEIIALTQAFREGTDEKQYCGIGSVKTNIGHLDTAAGVAALIKSVQALKHQQLPPSLHYTKPNPQIDFENSPFFVNAALKPWTTDGFPRRAAINSLGVGGTNAFVILEEAPTATLPPSGASRPQQLLLLSARSPAAVEQAGKRLASYLQDNPEVALADVAFTLATTRQTFKQRSMVIAKDSAEAAAVLAVNDPTRVFTQQAGSERSVAFLFPGGGAQYPNMGRDLYEQEAVYRKEVDRGLALLKPKVDYDLKPLLFPAAGDEKKAAAELQHGSRSLPSLFITEYALARLFMSWGVTPSAMLGHSMGEYVAACIAGVFTVEEGLSLVLKRGQLFEKLARGAMISVPMPKAELVVMMGDGLDIAVVNGPSATVAAGPVAAIEALEKQLLDKEVDVRRIRIHVAAHSRMLDPILEEFHALAKTIQLKAPELPIMSNVTGTWMTAEQATDPAYWVKHLRSTVQFSNNLEELLRDENRVVLEVAPGRTLSSLAKAHPRAGIGRPVFNSLRHVKEEVNDNTFILGVVGRLFLCGVNIDFSGYYAEEQRRRLSLPSYPFEHQRHWIEPGKTQAAAMTRSLRKKRDIADWFYQPSWKRQLLPTEPIGKDDGKDADAEGAAAAKTWLLFLDDLGFGAKLAEAIRANGDTVVTVDMGEQWAASGDHQLTIGPGQAEDYDTLWSALEENKLEPSHIIHLWSLVPNADNSNVNANDATDAKAAAPAYAVTQQRGFDSLLYLSQAIGKAGVSNPLQVGVVFNQLLQVAGEPVLCPERATLLGPCRVMPQEIAAISCRAIDIELPQAGSWREKLLLERLPREVAAKTREQTVAYRGHERLVQTFEPIRLPPVDPQRTRVRDGGVYLITGGLGGLGLVLAHHLADRHQAKLILLGRTPLPPRDEWDGHLDAKGSDDRTSRRILQVRELEKKGAEVIIAAADVTDVASVRRVVEEARDKFGTIHGVYHTAGVLNDGIIQLKTREEAAQVLAPKVAGTLALEAALKGTALDFMVLYSSVSSLTGLTGQVDYAGANAFLDSFAHAKTERDGIYTVAVNWNAWQHVGMAAELARELGVGGAGAADRPAKHPLLQRCVRDTPSQRIYLTDFRPEEHWLLDEHRIKGGHALIPGTGFLEIAHAALAEDESVDVIEVSDLFFQTPFVVRNDQSKTLRVIIDRSGDNWDVQLLGPGGEVHARGQVRRRAAADIGERKVDIEAIAARCDQSERSYSSAADENLDFGPRWNNRKTVRFGAGEALVALQLPREFEADCGPFSLHPALMDFATAGAQGLVEGYSDETHFYVPLSYGRVCVYAALTPKCFSHVRLRESSEELAVYDISIYDEAGQLLVDIDEFVMRRVEDRAIMTAVSAAANAQSVEARGDHEAKRAAQGGAATANPILELGLEQGIAPAEGMEALDRVLAAPLNAQLIVSSQDLLALMASIRAPDPWASEEQDGETTGTKVTRPNMTTAFVAPETDLHKTITHVWEELLGIEGIGINDDFFDLGGHSLLLTQLVSRVRKQLKAEISLRSLFEKRTVAGIADEVDKSKAAGDKPKGPQLKRVSRAAYRRKK